MKPRNPQVQRMAKIVTAATGTASDAVPIWLVMPITVTPARSGDADALAALAAITFPLACPPSADAADIEATLRANLSAQCFTRYLADTGRVVLVAVESDRIIGYAMLVRGRDGDPEVPGAAEPTVELSKMYVLPEQHRTGAAAALMEAGLNWAADGGAATVWLGVNQKNERAQRFYRKHGFEITGTRRFRLGRFYEDDFVMVRQR